MNNQTLRALVIVTSHGDIGGVPTTGVWFSEFSEPFEVFRAAGVAVTVASPRGGPAPIDPRGYPGTAQIAGARDALEILNKTARVAGQRHEDFDALFLPGGHGPMFDTASDPDVKRLVRDFYETNKPVAAVCHGPAGLLNVRLPDGRWLLEGKRVTGFSHGEDATDALFESLPFSLQDAMTAEGANFIEGAAHQTHVEVDGRLITGQNPESAVAAVRALLSVLIPGKVYA